MVFKAQNSVQGVEIEGNVTGISNITGQQTVSSGVVIISKEKSVYIPNTLEDFKEILNLLKDLVTSLPTVSLQPNPAFTQTVTELLLKISQIKEALK